MSFHQDLDNFTRDLHNKTIEVEYMKKNPVLALILDRTKHMPFRGGARYYKELDTGTHEDLVQDYTVNETLTHGVKDTSQVAYFRKKKMQCPVQIDVDEEMDNARQTPDGTQLQNLAKFRVKKANEAMRVHLRKKMYMAMSQTTASSDTNKYLQGLNNALEVDATYGTITRTYSAGTSADTGFYWQPMGGTVSGTVQLTSVAISINQMRTWFEPLEDLESDNTDLVTILGGTLWLSLQAEAEARSMPYTIEKNRTARQGFTEMILDGRRIIKDPFLKSANNTAMGETTAAAQSLESRVYGLNLKDWDFYIHPDSNFKMTEFFDQKKIAGGTDMKLARVLFKGNLVCWHPNSQLYYELVTP
jgi:hypothetical protein